MEVYLVGGAVRDEQLGLEINEQDWVLVGATETDLAKAGFKKVGKSFPVYLHPETKEEYALARKEKKTGPGYHGFEFDASPNVTLEEDLKRRDLTINAMAKNANGELIDPYKGLQDLQDRVLRHVSDSFIEDPLRVLRIAKFAARFEHFGFTIAKETMALLKRMSLQGDLENLVPERVFQELKDALSTQEPVMFFHVLRECGALKIIFPELDRLYGVPQDPKLHPEVDCGVHMELVLRQCALRTKEPALRFAALVHDLGKGATDKDKLPDHAGHQKKTIELIENLCSKLNAPNYYRDLSLLVAKFYPTVHQVFTLSKEEILELINKLDAFRKQQRFYDLLLVCECIFHGVLGREHTEYHQAEFLRKAFELADSIDNKKILQDKHVEPAQIKEAIHNARSEQIAHAMSQYERFFSN